MLTLRINWGNTWLSIIFNGVRRKMKQPPRRLLFKVFLFGFLFWVFIFLTIYSIFLPVLEMFIHNNELKFMLCNQAKDYLVGDFSDFIFNSYSIYQVHSLTSKKTITMVV